MNSKRILWGWAVKAHISFGLKIDIDLGFDFMI